MGCIDGVAWCTVSRANLMIHLTFDQDWAPAWATRWLLSQLDAAGLSGTFFVTHDCPSLADLRASGRVELAWHPNFLPGSSHGGTVESVLDTLSAWVPEARGARAHCLVRGTPYLQAYHRRGLLYDAADLRDGEPDLRAFVSWTGMVRLPIWFEDDVHIARRLPCSLEAIDVGGSGLHVMSFHPVLLALNARTPDAYAGLKAALQARGVALTDAQPGDFAPHRQEGGVASLLAAVLDWMVAHPHRAGGPLITLAEASVGQDPEH